MINADVIIVGGGPAGSVCARELVSAGYRVMILDKAEFPRQKLCAGWVTPRVFSLLDIHPEEYPRPLRRFKTLHLRLKGMPIALPTRQFAIRRFDFDHWLLERSGAEFYRHRVGHIETTPEGYLVDGCYAAPYLVGAGGTECPVARSLFESPEDSAAHRIVTLEEEFSQSERDERCFLWFFQRGLPGYAWYVPKADGSITAGVGGSLAVLQKRGLSIRAYWNRLVAHLQERGMVPERRFRPAGHSYYLRGRRKELRRGNALLIGDAAGLATRDMGEGIGPAIHSGLLAARAIIRGEPYSIASVRAYSAPDLLFPPSNRSATSR
jgi:flavin-dependent dehydrogenase